MKKAFYLLLCAGLALCAVGCAEKLSGTYSERSLSGIETYEFSENGDVFVTADLFPDTAYAIHYQYKGTYKLTKNKLIIKNPETGGLNEYEIVFRSADSIKMKYIWPEGEEPKRDENVYHMENGNLVKNSEPERLIELRRE